MKKLVILSVLAFSLCSPSFAENAVSNLVGTASIVRGGETLPVSQGTAFQTGDVIKTEADGTVDLAMNDLAGVRVLGGSEVIVENATPEAASVKVSTGNVILNLQKLPPTATFKVETPTAFAVVRGTQFWGRVDTAASQNPVTTFAVREGAVEIAVKGMEGATFTLVPGQALDIPKESAGAPIIRPALEAEMNAMAQADLIRTAA